MVRNFFPVVLSAWIAAGIVMAAGAAHAALPAVDSQGAPLPTLAPMLQRATPAVVNIATRSKVRIRDNPLLMDPFFRRFFGVPDIPRERQTQSLGSGVIVDAEHGYILTNHHVVGSADEIEVTLRDGRRFAAQLVGSDPDSDVAVVKVPAENLQAITLADSDRLQVGDFVVAIGNPFGLGQTVTSGIVSALGRSGLGIEGYEDFIQTDASINPGNSGGALVNLRGELVGINTAIIAPGGGNVGIGFAIPINMAHGIMEQILEYGEVRRGSLGIAVQDLTPQLAQAFGIEQSRGAVAVRVVEGSVGAKAGLLPGDVIVSVNGRRIGDANDLRNAVGLLSVGDTIRMDVIRDGKRVKLEAPLVSAISQAVPAERFLPVLSGATVSSVDETSPLFGEAEGVLVKEVVRGSAAWRAGLRPADVIVTVNREPVARPDDLASAAGASQLLLHVRRGDGALFLLLR